MVIIDKLYKGHKADIWYFVDYLHSPVATERYFKHDMFSKVVNHSICILLFNIS